MPNAKPTHRWRFSPPASRVRWGLFTLLLVSLSLVGCDEDPVPGPAPVPDLQNIWPNQDGRFWVYAMESKQWLQSVKVFATPEVVPAGPSLDEAVDLLQLPLEDTPVTSRQGTYRLHFDGMATTLTGVEGQNLTAFIDDQPVNGIAEVASKMGVSPGLLAQLWRARPDLRPSLVDVARASGSTLAVVDSFGIIPASPTFVDGGVWEKGEAWIGRYADLDQDLAWKYLEADLEPGHEFTFQVAKALADDVFLHVRVNRRVTVQTQAGAYVDALEVVYLLDFGIAMIADPLGEILGYTRIFSLGSVAYAPLAGPVWSEERLLYHVGDVEPSAPLMSQSLDLQERGRTR